MKNLCATIFLAVLASAGFISCSDNKAAEVPKKTAVNHSKVATTTAPVKKDGASIGSIETETYVLKLHRAFAYKPMGSTMLPGFEPKQGYKFIYLDVSLKNKSAETLDGGALFIALRVTDEKGVEYKKPAAALAAYTSEHPEDSNTDEYNALWEGFELNEFHRELVYAVEVPEETENFILHLPVDSKRKAWKELPFSL